MAGGTVALDLNQWCVTNTRSRFKTHTFTHMQLHHEQVDAKSECFTNKTEEEIQYCAADLAYGMTTLADLLQQ